MILRIVEFYDFEGKMDKFEVFGDCGLGIENEYGEIEKISSMRYKKLMDYISRLEGSKLISENILHLESTRFKNFSGEESKKHRYKIITTWNIKQRSVNV